MNKYLLLLEDVLCMVDKDIKSMEKIGVDVSPAIELRNELSELIEEERKKDEMRRI